MAKSLQSYTGICVSCRGLSVGREARMELGAGKGGAVNVTR